MANSLKYRRYRSRRAGVHMVTDLRPERNYTLWLRFDDGMEGHVYLGELMSTTAYGARLGEDDFFKVAIDPVSQALTWEGGIHMDPEVLYRNLVNRESAPLH